MLLPWSGTWTPAPQHTIAPDATGPFPILIPADPPPDRQSRMVLAGVAFALVVGLVLAVFSLRDFGRSDEPRSSSVSPVTATADDEPVAVTPTPAPTTPAVTPSPSATAAGAIAADATALDPQGDQEENDQDAPLVLDGKTSTQWRSVRYNSAAFGGLKKGVGLAIELETPARISSVELDVRGSGGEVELRGSDSDDDIDGSTVLDTADLDGDSVTLTNDSTDSFDYVIIWFTRLPKAGGEYRVEVSEVRVR